eukprot:jgi/Chlat1/1852/Chrsp141S02190
MLACASPGAAAVLPRTCRPSSFSESCCRIGAKRLTKTCRPSVRLPHGSSKLVARAQARDQQAEVKQAPSTAKSQPKTDKELDEAIGFTSDREFLFKLALISFGGAAAVKYGSLLVPALQTSPNLSVALFFIVAPPCMFVAWLINKRDN